MRGRFDNLKQILILDPVRDHQQIVYLVGSYEYPWLTQRALEFALFRTYAAPSISQLLDQTGQFARASQKRYDDTSLILAEMVEQGYDSERGRAALRQMNRMHGRFDISNDDYLYVLSTFIYEPRRWHEKFGWRQPTQHENLANYHFWCEVGRRMGIREIPASYEAFEAFNIAYERDHFRYTESNARIGMATVNIFVNWYPAPLRPLVRRGIYALLDEPLRQAFDFPRPNPFIKAGVTIALKSAAWVIRYLLPPRRKPYSFTQQPNRTYPQGYEIEQLGPQEETQIS